MGCVKDAAAFRPANIKSKPSISQREIAGLAGVSYDMVRYHMEDMKKREIIVRQGNGRSGKWIVL